MEYDKTTLLLKSESLNSKPRNSTLSELRDLKRIRLEEEQNDLLRKILHKKSGNSFLSKLNPFNLLKGKFKPMNLLKKLGILGLFASVATNFNDTANDIASRNGKYRENLSITDNIEALVSTVAGSIGSIFGISEEATQDAISSLRSNISGVLDNFIENTGKFGEAIDSVFSSINDYGGKVLNSISDKASKFSDVFMKQTESHKEFIKVVDKIEELKGSKGYVEEKDKEAYNALMKKGEELATELKEDKNFMARSGYAKNIDDFTNESKKEYNKIKERDNKQEDSESISNKIKKSLGFDSVKGVDKVETNKMIVRYVENAQRDNEVIAKEYKDRYLKIKKEEEQRLLDRKEEVEERIKSHMMLQKALKINQEQIEKDPVHKEVYLSNIEKIENKLKESNAKDKDIIEKLAEIDAQLSETEDKIKTSKNYTHKGTSRKRRSTPNHKRRSTPKKRTKHHATTSRQENFNLLRENAEVVASELGVDPKAIIAQQIQENGWRKKKLTGKNNYFNIKADKSWKGKKSKHRVWEIKNGKKVWQDDWFRDYDDPTESARDYAKFLKKNKRYSKALKASKDGATGEEFIDEVAKAGYATDPNYAKNIKSIMHGRTFRRLYSESEKDFTEVVEQPKKDAKKVQPVSNTPRTKIPTPKVDTPKETIVVDSGVKELADAIKEQGSSTTTTSKEKETIKESTSKSSILVDFKPSDKSIKELE